MAIDIKRVRFFDGQFLKEGEFQVEQRYHSHLRRRMNFLLFGQSGVVPMTPNDLALEVVSPVDKTFRVRAGMAIGQNAVEAEGRELILSEDSLPIDLDTVGILAGQTAVVTLHFEEEATDLSAEGEVTQHTRIKEKAVIGVGLTKPATPATGDPYVQLGSIVYDTMTVTVAGREGALLRTSLIAAAPVPTIVSISGTVSAIAGGAPVAMVINGTNLTGATAVTFPGDPAVTATVTSSTAVAVNVTVTAGSLATAGPKSFQVSTPGGPAFSPGAVVFTVAAALPTVTGLSGTTTVIAGGPAVAVVINGTNLLNATLVTFPGDPAVTAIVTSSTATTINAAVTAGAAATAGPKSFQVTTPGGTASSPGAVAVTVLLPPVITGVSGAVTAVVGGGALGFVINGSNLAGATALTFPGDPAVVGNVTASTASTVTASVTVGAAAIPGPKSFQVTTPAGTANSPGGVVFTVTSPVPAPTLTEIMPDSVTAGDMDIEATITGTNLLGVTLVSFSPGDVSAVIQPGVTSTSFKVKIDASGANAGLHTFTVTTPGGSITSDTGASPMLFNVLP